LRFVFICFLLIFLAMCISSVPTFNPYYEASSEAYEKLKNTSIDFLEISEIQDAKEHLNEASKSLYHYEKTQIIQYAWYLLFYIGYFVFFVYFNKGSTLGKRIMHLRVVADDGNKVSLKSLSMRFLLNGSRLFYGVNLCVLFEILLLLVMKNHLLFYMVYSLISFLSFGIEIGNLITFYTSESGSCLIDRFSKSHVEEF